MRAPIREQIPEVQYVAAGIRGNSQLVYAESNWSTSWQGVQPDFFEINGWKLASGDGLQPGDYSSAAKSVVIGETVRRELFGDEDPLGQSLRIGKVPFRVVGVLAPKGQGGFGQDQDDVIMVPLETARRRLSGASGAPPGIGAADRARRHPQRGPAPTCRKKSKSLLRERHRIAAGAEDDFAVRNISEIVATRTADHAGHVAAAGRGRRHLAAGRRHRHHEHHAGLGDRADPRDRPAHGGRRGPARHPAPVPDRGDADLLRRRRASAP